MSLRTLPFAAAVLASAFIGCLSIPYPQKFSEPTSEVKPRAEPASYYWLPKTTRPLHYDLTFVVDPDAEHFSGETRILLLVLEDAVSQIVLHSNNLNVSSIDLKAVAGAQVKVNNWTSSQDARHFLTLNLDANLTKGAQYDLHFAYNATYGSDMFGLYKSSYVAADGKTRYLVVTQLGLVAARNAFPCYDEPTHKALFNVHIYSPPNYTAIFNTEKILSDKPAMAGYNVTSFRTTPLMSTYLIAFVVSDFEYKSNIEHGPLLIPKEFRVYARPTAANAMGYALESGQKSLQFLQAYVDTPYRLAKVDNVAVPDFAYGAMENWGIVTYGQNNLLHWHGESGTQAMTRTATILSHELAHFWFGDEVTPAWWDYTWLSEGFATFFEQYATENITKGEWRLMEQFVVNRLHDVMNEDSLPTTNSMTTPVASPAEILANFNTIAYQKAASVIRMMQFILGENVFRFGLSNYLKSLPTGNAVPKNLYDEMQKSVTRPNILPKDVTVEHVFGSWANQAGYPVVYAERTADGAKINVRQQRFYQNASMSSEEEWWVPLTWTSSSKPDFEDATIMGWLTPNQTMLELEVNATEEWFMFNKQNLGYFRVMYDTENWKRIITFLREGKHDKIHPLNRAQLINDAFTFSNTRAMSYKITFDLLHYLANETDFIPWVTGNRVMSFLDAKMVASQYYNDKYSEFQKSIIEGVFKTVNLTVNEKDSYIQKRLSTMISPSACKYGIVDCVNEAQTLLKDYIEKGTKPYTDIRTAVYCGGLRTGLAEVWNGLYTMYQREDDQAERRNMLHGLGCTPNVNTLNSFLQMTLNVSLKSTEDIESAVLSTINGGPIGTEAVLRFMNNDFLRLKEKLATYAWGTRRIIETLGNVIIKTEHIAMFQTFATKYEKDLSPAEKTSLDRAWQSIDESKIWVSQNLQDINTWLKENFEGSAGRAFGKLMFILSCVLFVMFNY